MSTPTYSDHDRAIWYTRDALRHLDDGMLHVRPPVPSPFPPSLGPDERMLAGGDFERLAYRALGDGSYVHDSSFFFATGGVGLAASAAFMGARAIGNKNRRDLAAAAARPRWVAEEHGAMWVSQHGFYLLSAQAGLWPCSFEHVEMAQIVHSRLVAMSIRFTTGPTMVGIHSDWAELVFTLWARQRHPEHPQYLGEAWIPAGWHDRDRARAVTDQAPRQLEER